MSKRSKVAESTREELKPFVDDALDEIEYVVGDAHTYWGAKRVADGHPAPFKLTYVEIGNEDWSKGEREWMEGQN